MSDAMSSVSITTCAICVMMMATVTVSMICTGSSTNAVDSFFVSVVLVADKYMSFSLCYLMIMASGVAMKEIISLICTRQNAQMDLEKHCYGVHKAVTLAGYIFSMKNDDKSNNKPNDDVCNDKLSDDRSSDDKSSDDKSNNKPNDARASTQKTEITECTSDSGST